MNTARRGLVPACLAAFLGACNLAEAQDTALPGTTYESLQRLPDWSGWWGTAAPFTAAVLLQNPPPLTNENLTGLEAAVAAALVGTDDDPDPYRFCRPSRFVGYSGGFVESVEFLFTPGRVTITNEMGLVRRIYTDGRRLPEDFEESNTGTSVGRWEGQTLVVETVGIDHDTPYPGPEPGAIAIGANVKITERIALTDPDTLEFDIVTVAPDIFTAPDHRRRVYVRVPKPAAREITFCADHDRSIDPVTGKQRFDMTPPADLPPPPAAE